MSTYYYHIYRTLLKNPRISGDQEAYIELKTRQAVIIAVLAQ